MPASAAIVIDANVTLSDQELGVERNNWSGATLTIGRKNGASVEDVFGTSGVVSLSGSSISVGGTTIGSFTNASGTLAPSFIANATTALVDQAVPKAVA